MTARIALLALVAGGAAAAYGFATDPARTWLNLMVDSFYFMTIGVSAIFFFATQRLTGARWSAALRRIPEAFMLTLPVAAALMIIVALGAGSIYPWAAPGGLAHHGPHAAHAAGKTIYLAPGFVLARMAAVLLVWIAFALRIRRISLAQEADPAGVLAAHRSLDRCAAVFAPVFAVTLTAASYDWLISLEPDWFSTMFAVYVFAGVFVQGIAAIALATVILHRRGRFGDAVGTRQLHDLGKLLFAFSTFWAYIWVCQYLLIWYGNIPEEVSYYARRTGPAWLPLFLACLVVNWIAPFLALMSARAKQSWRVLAASSALLLVGHWLDLAVMVMPARWAAPQLGIIEVGLALGCGALFVLVVRTVLARAPLVPTGDPILAAARLSRGGDP